MCVGLVKIDDESMPLFLSHRLMISNVYEYSLLGRLYFSNKIPDGIRELRALPDPDPDPGLNI